MTDVTVKRLDELECYRGPNELEGIRFLFAGKSLGVTAWGMNVLELAPGCLDYPEHHHEKDGQEEVYVLLRGAATIRVGHDEWPLSPGTFVRVGPAWKRKLVPGPGGATVLALGGTPGKAYEPRG